VRGSTIDDRAVRKSTGLRTPWARQMRNGLRRTPREGRGEHLFGINDNSRRSALTHRTTLPHADEGRSPLRAPAIYSNVDLPSGDCQ
jgi:hypothetical protein